MERTVYNDIYFLIENYNELIELDFSHSNIISSHTSVGNIQFIYENIIASQPRTKLLRLLIERPNMPLEFYSCEIDKSQQSTRKLMCELDDILQTYDVKLNGKRSRYEIIGDEKKVRFFIASFYDSFQRNFMLPKVQINYDQEVDNYFEISSKLRYFLDSLEESSAQRYRQGYRLYENGHALSLNQETQEVIKSYISALNTMKVKIEDNLDDLMFALGEMGYDFDDQWKQKVTIILCHILHMRDAIYSVNNVNLHSVLYYVKNYSRLNKKKFANHQHKIEEILSRMSPDYKHVFANLIFNIDSIQPALEQPKSLNVMIYSDISRDHAFALKAHLSSTFPLNQYYVYEGEITYRAPEKSSFNNFYWKNNCRGVISTCDFPYKVDKPKVTVSSYLVGCDIGRIYDFFHDLKRPQL